MRIGIVVTTGPENGGTYFYSIAVLNALRDFGLEHEYVVFYDSKAFPVEDYIRPNWILHQYVQQDTVSTKAMRVLSLTGFRIFFRGARGRHAALLSYDLDLVICPSTTLAAWWCNLPFIVSVHDVWHRYNLPGTRLLNVVLRDVQWRRASESARLVLVESELGKSELISAYNIPESSVGILPTGPASFIWNPDIEKWPEIISRYNLSETYIFYPGGFSLAKNQLRIVEAVAILRSEKKVDVHAILAGPRNEYSNEILGIARKLGINDLIHTVGLVPDSDMYCLYKGALGLVMASYIGPTNMPIWEAFAAGCPVISSNAGEMPLQVGDAGLLFDPSDKHQLAKCIWELYINQDLRLTLVERGRSRINHVHPKTWSQNLLSIVETVRH